MYNLVSNSVDTSEQVIDIKWKGCDIFKINMHRNPASAMFNTYELKISMFNTCKPEEFLVLMKNFKAAIDGKLTTSAPGIINYLCTILRGEALI